jgi:hypothetical protein
MGKEMNEGGDGLQASGHRKQLGGYECPYGDGAARKCGGTGLPDLSFPGDGAAGPAAMGRECFT